MESLRTVIIDDEPDSIRLLQLQLEKYCPQVKVIATYSSSVKALQDLEILQPQLVFLDIEMPVINGFELLDKTSQLNYNVIFVTAYNQYALKAFRFNALDYLLKPVDADDLVEAIAKAENRSRPSATQINELKKHLKGEPITKIAIPDNNGVTFIDLDDIVYSEASNNYSKLFLSNGQSFLVSKTLKDVQEVLEESHFLRIHRQYIINLNHVKQLNRSDCIITMDNGRLIPIARNQKDKLIERYRWL